MKPMKIIAAKFTLEANEHVPMFCDLENTALSFGQEALSHMQLGEVIDRSDLELIPVLCADAGCSGVMRKGAYDYLKQRILKAVQAQLPQLDGIYLHLHGASFVEEIGSGEQDLIRAIRELTGPYLPIAVACDPHGNLTQEYVENTTFIRSYRQAPHTDIAQTVQRTFQTLIDQIQQPQGGRPIYRKLPLILGGEQSVSADEPVRSINQFMDELEKDPRILSCSWHVGYLRHDCPEAGCGIVVIPASRQDQAYAETIADQLAAYVWDKRHEFHYTGTTASPEQALEMALNFDGKPVFITDSGDNVTSGAMGANTFILRQVLKCEANPKKFLFAAIQDPAACARLADCPVGQSLSLRVGMGLDEYSEPVDLTVTVLHHGRQAGTAMYGEEGDYGPIVTVHIQGTQIDLAITDNNHSFVEERQIQACGVSWDDYDVIVVKQGYIHPEMKAKGKLCVMSLTGGATPQDTRLIPFKQILRPMYPIDEI